MAHLPIGTIVKLKKSDVSILIFGKQQKRLTDQQIYDYLGCIYPEGYQSNHTNIFFNQEHIENVIKAGQSIQQMTYGNYKKGW